MKLAVSLPDELFEHADRAAARIGLNRSQFYARALRDFLDKLGDDPVTARLDEMADRLPASQSAAVARRLIDSGAWEW